MLNKDKQDETGAEMVKKGVVAAEQAPDSEPIKTASDELVKCCRAGGCKCRPPQSTDS